MNEVLGTPNQSVTVRSKTFPYATLLAFTLVEMLVVIAIIAILASLLLPSLSASKWKSRLAVCLNNQRQQGIGLAMYLQDHEDTYPVCETWATYGGKTGMIGEHAGIIDAKERPLNAYVGNTESFSCPSDAGETGRSVIRESGRRLSCFDAWGTSYSIAAAYDRFRVKHVMAFKSGILPPMKGSEVAVSPANKVIQGDWNWFHGQDPSWHWAGSKHKYAILFGDGHCAGLDLSEGKDYRRDESPDPAWRWW